MLAVISVYHCRYCTWFHTLEALRSRIGRDDVSVLLEGDLSKCPEEERVALFYAQHWADSNACPDSQATLTLEREYGTEKSKEIQLLLRMIRIGNLSGNTWDKLLNRFSPRRLLRRDKGSAG
jgi:hypothetical protein